MKILLLLLSLSVFLLPVGLLGQAAPPDRAPERPVCPEVCQGSLSCRVCALKLDLYRQWMEEVGRGVELLPLPDGTIALLAPHFPEADLSEVRVGSTRRQLADGITDCNRIYLADPVLTRTVHEGRLPSGVELEFLLHEFVHVEQCARLGGRDAYALLWFRDVGLGALGLLLAGGGWMGLHSAMPMEAEAAERAARLAPVVEASLDAVDP